MFDIAVIGGGVIGGAVLRELTRFRYDCCMLEKENDVCMGQSKANSGIVHAGFDAPTGSNKAKFNVLGCAMMAEYAAELGVKYVNNGSLVVAFDDEEVQTLYALLERGKANGVAGLRVIDRAELVKTEPNISDDAIAALYAPTAGIVCPYELTIASIGNAMDNGARLFTDFDVADIRRGDDGFTVIASDGRSVTAKLIINCAGIGAGKIAKLCGDDTVEIGGRAGEYILLDRESGGFVRHTLFGTPTQKGKGILVTPTVDGNILMGPTARPVADGQTVTTRDGLNQVIQGANKMCKAIPHYNTITSFCGVRAYCSRHDFIIEQSKKAGGLINCCGIESPGLTSAPAIGKYVAEQIVLSVMPRERNREFNGKREPDCAFKNMSVEQKNELIRRDPAYGKIVCRCEGVTEGEIAAAIHKNPPACNVDAVKRRTRSGMGRCQGGFCQPHVAEILARELNIPFETVTKSGKDSRLVVGKSK